MTTLETKKASGNTTTSASNDTYRKGRNFFITVQESQYNQIPIFVQYVQNLSCFQYILITEHDKEDDGTMRKHQHIYLQLSECRTLAKKKIGTLHCEQCLGSAQQNYEYLTCQDKKHIKLGVKAKIVYEDGEMLLRGGSSVKDAINMTDEELLIQNKRDYNMIVRIKNDYANKPKKFTSRYKDEMEVIYICGKSDSNKTKWVYDFFKQMEDKEPESDIVKYDGKYWTGFNEGIEWGIYEEWRDYHMKPTEFINFIDYYSQRMRVLYGFKDNNYKHIIITTVQDLATIYRSSSEDKFQWFKRITRYINLEKNIDMSGREYYNEFISPHTTNDEYEEDQHIYIESESPDSYLHTTNDDISEELDL